MQSYEASVKEIIELNTRLIVLEESQKGKINKSATLEGDTTLVNFEDKTHGDINKHSHHAGRNDHCTKYPRVCKRNNSKVGKFKNKTKIKTNGLADSRTKSKVICIGPSTL